MPERFEICDGAAELWYLTDNDDAGRADDVTLPVLVSVPSDAKICRNVNTGFGRLSVNGNRCLPSPPGRINACIRDRSGADLVFMKTSVSDFLRTRASSTPVFNGDPLAISGAKRGQTPRFPCSVT